MLHTHRLLFPALLVAVLATVSARAQPAAPDSESGSVFKPVLSLPCTIPPDLARFEHPIARTAQRIAVRAPVKIVAIGSSSTYGEGASAPERSYPSRLVIELGGRFAGQRFTIVNRGVNGDNDFDKRARFERDVIAEKPDIVLWQLGTNSLVGGDSLDAHLPVLQGGVDQLRNATAADIVLIDPQYAPKVLSRGLSQALAVVEMIAATARGTNVNLFRRFELMRRWREVDQLSYDKFLSPDAFHMNDWSYACVARAMGDAIAEAATRR